MSHYLPPQIMAFFQPRPPMPFKEPLPKRTLPGYHGVAEFVPHLFRPVPPPVKHETREEKKERRRLKRDSRHTERVKRQLAKWDPKKEENDKTKDAYKTLFVARLAYDVIEEDLKKEFEFYGAVKSVKVLRDKKGKSRGYAFVEFESSKELKEAYKDADGRKINGRRILVDVERGRTVKDWKPRRLGGGLGATRAIGAVVQKHSGREPPANAPPTASGGQPRRRSRERDAGRDTRDTRPREPTRDPRELSRDPREGAPRDTREGAPRDTREGAPRDTREGAPRDTSRDTNNRDNRDNRGRSRDRRDKDRDGKDRDTTGRTDRDAGRGDKDHRAERSDKDKDRKHDRRRSRSPKKERDRSRERERR